VKEWKRKEKKGKERESKGKRKKEKEKETWRKGKERGKDGGWEREREGGGGGRKRDQSKKWHSVALARSRAGWGSFTELSRSQWIKGVFVPLWWVIQSWVTSCTWPPAHLYELILLWGVQLQLLQVCSDSSCLEGSYLSWVLKG
jgi:hypothetical protein